MKKAHKFISFTLLLIGFSGCNLPGLDQFPLDFATFRLFSTLFAENIQLIGGEVRGLEGTGLRLSVSASRQDSSIQETETIEIASNGRFAFKKNFTKDLAYTVQIETQPSNPTQICEIGGATGIVGQSSTSSVLVQCNAETEVAMPEFSPPPGIFSTATQVIVSSSTANNTIYYTIDGSEPNCSGSSGTQYTTPILLAQPTLPAISIKAIACVNDRVSSIQIGNFSVTNGQLAIPTVNVPPSGAAYTTAQNVTLSPPGGATVHYTTNGSTPTCTSPSTPNPVNVASSLTIQAISCQADWTPSSVASFFYNITGTVAPVSFSQGSNTFNNDVSLSLSTGTAGASIRYVLFTGGDPGTPDCSTSTLYTGPILLNTNNTQIRAIGCLTDWVPSAVSALEIYNFQVTQPIFSPVAGSFATNTSIAGTTTTTGATVYLAEGSAPACGGATNLNLTISGDGSELTKDIYAIACRAGYTNSATNFASYTMTGTIGSATFGTASGSYGGSTNTTIIPGAVFPGGGFIRYTVDGTDPTCATGIAYTLGDSVSIPSSLTIKAITCKTSPAWIPSSIASATYNITGIVADPSFVPGGAGSFIIPISVTISTATAGAHIQYSLNTAITDCSQGTFLASGGTVNITVTGTTLYAIGCKSGDANSAVISATYTLKPNTPTASVPANTYNTAQTINFSSSAGTSIYYTIDGSDPSCAPAGTLGTTVTLNPFQGAVTVKAIACRTDFAPSNMFTGIYQMNGQITSPTWNYSNDATNTLTGTLNSPPIVTSQKLCYRVDADPQCSLTNNGTANNLGGECAVDSTAYVNPLTVTASGSYRAIACSANYLSSAVQAQNVTISGSVGNVIITPGTGTVTNDPTVTMSATNSTAIYYRTDAGPNPNCSGTDGSTLYTAGFSQPPFGSGTTQIRAIGCAPGFSPSGTVISATYTYNTAAPTFSLATGTYFTNQNLAINTTTIGGATIYYRVDGTAPTCGVSAGNFLYSPTITLPTDTNFTNLDGVIQPPAFRAIACKTNYNPTIATAPEYFFNVDSFTVSVGAMLYVDSATTLKNDTIGPTTLQLATPNPPGAVFCFRNDGTEPGCSKTAGGTASNSGDFCALGSTLASANVITAASTGNYVARGCKLGYKHSAPKQLNLTVQEFRPRIFVSNTAVNGGTSVVDADAVCNADINRPFQKPEANYRAFRMGGGRTLTSNWVLEANTDYYTLANLPVGLTPPEADSFNIDVPLTLSNSIDPLGTFNVYTGIFVNGGTARLIPGSVNCNNWTDSTTGVNGGIGNSSLTNSQFVNTTQVACNNLRKLYCVEQNPRKRIFITSNGKAIGTDFSGKAQADAVCNDPADPRKPTTGSYKALLRFSDRTHPSTDWVLKPETTYYRTDRTTVIGTTDAASIFATNFTNAISTEASEQAYLGFGNNWTPSANNCDDYTNSAGTGGGGANAHMTTLNSGFLGGFTAPCNNYRIICVEQ